VSCVPCPSFSKIKKKRSPKAERGNAVVGFMLVMWCVALGFPTYHLMVCDDGNN